MDENIVRINKHIFAEEFHGCKDHLQEVFGKYNKSEENIA